MVAGQDLFWEEQGAYTAAVSGLMLKDAGADYVIIGHSERRQYFFESDETVNKKIKAALRYDLKSIVCVGETLAEREAGQVYEVVNNQISAGLENLTQDDANKLVIAYEPIWAIGKDARRGANPEESLEMILYIKKTLTDMFGASAVDGMTMLYGGSVTPANAKMFLREGGADGLLIGRASLDPKTFSEILNGANEL